MKIFTKGWIAFFIVLIVFFNSVSAQEKSAEIDGFMQKMVARGQFNGTVLVEDHGKVIYQKGFGYADFQKKTPVESGTIFELASISKTFTSMAVMILAERGKLKYDDDLKKYFPAMPYDGITIRHMLTHTSGLPEYLDLFYAANNNAWDTKKIETNADIIALLEKQKPALHFKPGERWEYSNTAFCLLASIVEKVSGQNFSDFLSSNIFKPLGMKDTSLFTRLSKVPIAKRAPGFVKRNLLGDEYDLPENVPNTAFVITLGGIVGDGSVHSTAGDLRKWADSLNTEKLVKKKTIEEAFTRVKLNDGSEGKTYENSRGFESGYGFGWFIRKGINDSRVVWHTGGWPGYVTYFHVIQALGQSVVVLSNGGSTAVPRMGQVIEKILAGQPYDLPRLSIAQAIAQTVNSFGGEASVKLYRDLKQNKAGEYIFAQGELNRLGYELLEQKKFADAITIFKLNVDEYPKSADPYDSLGEAYMKNGENEQAIKNYEKSLELDPSNNNAVDMLKVLKNK